MPRQDIAPCPGGLRQAPEIRPPQGLAPVYGCLSGGCSITPSGDWDSGNPTFALSRGSPSAPPLASGHGHWFSAMLFSLNVLSDSGKASDPEISPLISARYAGDTAVRLMAHVGWAARRGPVFMLDEPGPFPGSLPPNRTCTFSCIRLSSDLCRVRGGVRVDPVVAWRADDERLAPHSRHEGGPRGLSRSRFPEVFEAGDLVDCHRGAGLAEFALPFAEPSGQLLAGVEGRAGRGVGDDRPPVLPQDDPAESCH